MDGRFYRRSMYDVARTLAGFAAALREQVELANLTDQLLEAVEDTMQPAYVSLWLRERALIPRAEFDAGRAYL